MTSTQGSADAELALVGCLLLGASEHLHDLSEDDFTDPRLWAVVEAVSALIGAGQAVDPVTIHGHLHRTGQLSRITLAGTPGAVLLAEAFAAPASVASVGAYAQIVREARLRRRIVQVAQRLDQAAATASIESLGDLFRSEYLAVGAMFKRIAS